MIGIAAIKVVKAPERVRTVLGSCIGVALYDRISKVGGMAHVILPDSSEGSGDPGKFADTDRGLWQRQVEARMPAGTTATIEVSPVSQHPQMKRHTIGLQWPDAGRANGAGYRLTVLVAAP